MQEVKSMEPEWLPQCNCDPAWKDRELVDPQCHRHIILDYLPDSLIAAHEPRRVTWEQVDEAISKYQPHGTTREGIEWHEHFISTENIFAFLADLGLEVAADTPAQEKQHERD